jgi:hypothetical protein
MDCASHCRAKQFYVHSDRRIFIGTSIQVEVRELIGVARWQTEALSVALDHHVVFVDADFDSLASQLSHDRLEAIRWEQYWSWQVSTGCKACEDCMDLAVERLKRSATQSEVSQDVFAR